jgi:hypothetical protein
MTNWGPSFLHAQVLNWWLPLVSVPLLLLGFARCGAASRAQRTALCALLAAMIGGFGGLCVAKAGANVLHPPDWDVKAFWMFGKVAASGENYYSPAAFHAVAHAIDLHADDPDFTPFVLDVGFYYPPPAILLVAPFGLLDLRTAAAVWYLVQLTALAVAIGLLWEAFFRSAGGLGLAVTAALVLSLRATYTTIAFGQTNFLVLALVLLLCRNAARARGGFYLGLAIVVKPLLVLLIPYLAFGRRWRVLGVAGATIAGLSTAALLLFGPAPFASYWAANPVARIPATLYAFDENQSLVAAIARWTHFDFDVGSPLAQPWAIAAVVAVAVATACTIACADRRTASLTLMLTLVSALLIYPQSWEHYTVLLVVPLAWLWTSRRELDVGTPTATAVISLVYALNRWDHGRLALLGTIGLWATLAVASVRATLRARAAATGLPALAPN